MAPGKDQQDSAFARVPGFAPKNGDSGPEFDFSDPRARAAEASLREAARELEAALQVSLEDLPEGEAYRRALAAAEALLPALYSRYDAYLGAVLATGDAVACSRGCSACCSHYVTSVEPYELIFLHGRIRALAEYPSRLVSLHRRAALFKGLVRAGDGDEAEDRALHRYYLRNQPCPFLTASGACGVYASRPISCRMFFSQSHPSYCRGKAVTSPGNRNFIMELPEDIEASLARAGRALARFEFPESLFEGLLRANELFGRFDAEAGEGGEGEASRGGPDGPGVERG